MYNGFVCLRNYPIKKDQLKKRVPIAYSDLYADLVARNTTPQGVFWRAKRF